MTKKRDHFADLLMHAIEHAVVFARDAPIEERHLPRNVASRERAAIVDLGLARIGAYEHELLTYGTQLFEAIPEVRLIGTASDKAAVLSFVIDGVHPHDAKTLTASDLDELARLADSSRVIAIGEIGLDDFMADRGHFSVDEKDLGGGGRGQQGLLAELDKVSHMGINSKAFTRIANGRNE